MIFLHVKDGYFIAKDGMAKGAPLIVKDAYLHKEN
jgi:hypothetical protein